MPDQTVAKTTVGHTAGPWKVESGINDYDIVVGNARLAGYIQREADADLIAAAPELLEALKLAVRLMDEADFDLEPDNDEGRLALIKARAAIAKAEGR